VRFTLTRVQRTVVVLGAVVAASFSPAMATFSDVDAAYDEVTWWVLPVIGSVALIAATVVSLPSVEVRSRELVVRWVTHRRVIPWADVLSVSSEQVGGFPGVVVRTVDGQFVLPVPAVGDASFDERAHTVAAAFAASDAADQAFRPLRPWGRSLDDGAEARVGMAWSRVLSGPGAMLWILAFGLVLRWWFFPPAWLVILSAGILGAIAAANRWPRTLVTSSGVDMRGLKRRFIPWAAVGSILVVKPPWWSGYGRGSERVCLITTLGAFDVPGLVRTDLGSDPEFDRKVDFLRRSWVEWRGPAWVGPPPPPPPHAEMGRTTE
jgi:hypothetical protein